MGTLYDLLGALPTDGAEELRAAFRRAAKATHPDTNPDNPEAALRFRELLRAYDILTDPDQRATYDHLLAIALQPTTLPSTRYETVRKVASNTMVASVILAVLVGGYIVFGLFSRAPSAAEMVAGLTAGGNPEVAAAPPAMPAQEEPRDRREAGVAPDATGAMAAAVAAAAAKQPAPPVGRLEAVPPFLTYNLGLPYYPRLATTYFDRGAVPYRRGPLDRPLTDITAARRMMDSKRPKTATPTLRRPPLMIVPVMHERRERESVTAALTP
jgi:hypothetical protein